MTDLIYASLCALFLASLPVEPFLGQETLKAAPVIFLAWSIFRSSLETRFKKTLIPAFLCSAAGDVFLHLNLSQSFMLGLGSFLVGHLFFITTNLRSAEFARRKVPVAVLIVFVLILVMSAVRPGAEERGLFIPALVYGLVLSTMAITSLFATSRLALGLGGVLFVLSDSLIAWRAFVGPTLGGSYGVMVSYYAAQYFLYKGYLGRPPVTLNEH